MEYRTISELCELVVDCPHSTPIWTDSGKIVIRNQYIKNGRIDFSAPSYTDEEHFLQRISRAKPMPGDIVITREAPMGDVGMIPDGIECCLGQRMVLLRANPNICDRYYLLYSLQSRYVQHQISWSEGTGTTVSNLRIPHLKQLKIPYPPMEKQRKIASILKSIEERMETNRKINDSLQKIFTMLYAETFVEKRAPSWEAVPLSEIFFFQEGPGIRNWQYVPNDGTKFINIRCIADGDINTATANMISNDEANGKYAHFMLEPYDIVMSCSGTLGRYAIVRPHHLPLCLNTSVIRFRPHRGFEDFSFLYGYLTSKEFLNKQRELACGSVQANFGPTHLKKMDIVAPPVEVRNAFHRKVFPLVSQIIQLRDENNKLSEVRDELLPKLMSGEVDVSDIQL